MLTLRAAAKPTPGGRPGNAPDPARRTGWRRLALALVVLAFGLRVYGLEAKSIWLDEALSFHRAAAVDRAVSGLLTIGGVPSRDTQPPLYFVLLYGFLKLAGVSDFAGKFPSVLFSTLLIPVLAVAGRRLGGWRAGALAALLAAASPLHVWYAQEVRMYALLAFFAGLVVYLGCRSVAALDHGNRRAGLGWATAALFTAGLGTLTQYVAVFTIPAVGFGLAAATARRWPRLALLGVGALAVVGPLILVEAAWGRLITAPTPQFERVPAPVILWDLVARTAAGLTLEGPVLNGLGVVFGILAALGLAGSLNRPAGWWLAGAVIIPALTTALVGAQKPLISNVRHLIFATPGLYIAAGLGLHYVARRVRWAAAPVLGILLAGAGVGLAGYFDPSLQKDDFRALVRFLEANVGPADLVLVHEATVLPVFEHYDPGYLQVEALPRFGESAGDRLTPELEARLRHLQQTYRRIWFVYWPRSIAGDPAGLIPNWLDRNLFAASDRPFAGRGMGVAVRMYLTRPPVEPALPAGIQPVNLRSADGLRLLGWQVQPAPTADGRVELSIYLRPEQAPISDYQLVARLVDDRDHVWAQFDGRPVPTWPSGRWPAGEIIRVDLLLRLEPGAPAGTYRLEVGLAPPGADPVPLLGPAGNPVGTLVELGEVSTGGAYRTRPEFEPAAPTGPVCGCGLRIRDAVPQDRTTLPGRLLTVRAYYRVERPADLSAHRFGLELRRDGRPAAAGIWPLVSPVPAGLQAGDWLAGAYDLRVPAGVAPGEYRLVGRILGPENVPEPLYHLPGLAVTEFDLGTVRVVEPDRRFEPPSPSRPADAYFGNLLHLEGYDQESAGPHRLRVTLYWRVLGRSDQKLKVSVQLFDGPRLVAQDDGVPVGWTRPASTWLPGEYLTDPHEISLPPESRPETMRVILYDEATGRRAPVVGPGGAGDGAEFSLR